MPLTKLDPNVIGQDSTGAGKITSAGGSVSVDSNGVVRIANATANSVTVAANGFVGVLEPSPDLALHVNGSAGAPANTGSTPTGFISLRRKNVGATHGLNMGVTSASPFGSWLQAQDSNNLATNYPISINPNGGNVGIGTLSPAVSLDVGSRTDAIRLPVGNTAQRPTGSTGLIRYNGDSNTPEWYSNNAWNSISPTSDPYYTSTKVLIKNGSLVDASYVRRTISMTGTVPTTSSIGYPPVSKSSSLTGSAGNVWNISTAASNYLTFGGTLSHFDLSQANWTLEYWMYINIGSNAYGHTFWCGGQSNQGEFKVWSQDGKPYLYSGAGSSVMVGVSPASNTWTWIVFEKYNNTIYAWVNGQNRTSSTSLPTGGTPGTAGLGIPHSTEYYSHYVDEVRFTTVSRYQGASVLPLQTVSWPEQ